MIFSFFMLDACRRCWTSGVGEAVLHLRCDTKCRVDYFTRIVWMFICFLITSYVVDFDEGKVARLLQIHKLCLWTLIKPLPNTTKQYNAQIPLMKEIISLLCSFSSITIHNYAFIEQIWLNARLIVSAGCVTHGCYSTVMLLLLLAMPMIACSCPVLSSMKWRDVSLLNMDRRLSYHKIYVFLIFSAFEHFPTSTAR